MRLPAIAFVLCALAVPDAPGAPCGRLAAGRLRRPAALLQQPRAGAGPALERIGARRPRKDPIAASA